MEKDFLPVECYRYFWDTDPSTFYMAGGTGLALQLGHRRSIDLDFFTKDPFDPSNLAAKIAAIGHFSVESKSEGTLYGLFHDIKLSFFMYQYPLLKDFHHKVHILKSLIYFDEAEQEPLPQMLRKIEWDEVKKFFVNQVKSVYRQWE